MRRDNFTMPIGFSTVTIPPVPTLDVERYAAWPYPGMTASDQACSWLSTSTESTDMLEAVISSQGDAELNNDQVKAPIPQTDAIS